MRALRRRRSTLGFTLVEVAIVVVIAAVPELFSAAVTPVLADWSLMAATAADRRSAPEVAVSVKDTFCAFVLSPWIDSV